MVYRLIALLFFVSFFTTTIAQTNSYDSLKQAIINLDSQIKDVQLNLETSQRKFKVGILIATIGYTTTITGGLMLGRSNDDLGQALLVAGGATGIIGTYKMVDAFSFLTGRKKKKKKTY